jgi:uncharacterized membrane protein YdjX (TVP38/TMEM64 family)
LIYQVALQLATGDCQTIQTNIRAGGINGLSLVFAATTILAIFGAPIAIISALAGLLLGPITGGAMTSAAISAGAILAWLIARWTFRKGAFPDHVEKKIQQSWYQEMMDQRTDSAFDWVKTFSIKCPLSFPHFTALVAVKVRHLKLAPIISGIFAASILYVIAYSLAGGSIGCAAVNHAVGADIAPYKNSIIGSCLLLLILAKFQKTTISRGEA